MAVGFLANMEGGLRIRVTGLRGLSETDTEMVELLRVYIRSEQAYELQGWMDRNFTDLKAQRYAEFLRLKAEFEPEGK